jgi:cytochrome P450
VDLDIFDSLTRANPYPVYEALGREGPIVWSSNLEAWLVTGYDQAVAILQDHRAFSNRDRG